MDIYDRIPTLEEAEKRDWGRDFWSSWKWIAFAGLPIVLASVLDFMGYRRACWAVLAVMLTLAVGYFASRAQNQRDRIEGKLDVLIAELDTEETSPRVQDELKEISDDVRRGFRELSSDLSKLHSEVYKLSLDMHYLKQKRTGQ